MKISALPSFGAGRIPASPQLAARSNQPQDPNYDTFEGPPEPPEAPEPPLKKSDVIFGTLMFAGVPLTGTALGAYAGYSMATAHPILGMAAGAVGGLLGTLFLGTIILNGPTC